MAFATAEEYKSMSGNFIHDIIDEDLKTGKHTEIVTRFPPEPNGYLHIGHAKSLCLNFGTALKYGGRCNLRYDDTNPAKEDVEFVKSIENDVNWLGFQWDEKLWASDYFDTMYEAAVELIKKGKAYVCELTPEQIREYRGTLTEPGKESPDRERPAEENLELFEKMRNGEFADGEVCLRAKIDMASPNINMRDPVIYRVVHQEHHNTKDKWCIYPMYDFALFYLQVKLFFLYLILLLNMPFYSFFLFQLYPIFYFLFLLFDKTLHINLHLFALGLAYKINYLLF